MENPYDFKPDTPEWFKEKQREKRRKYREKRLGRPIGKHGGNHPGAGRPRTKTYTHIVHVNLTRIQTMLLEEMGGIEYGLQRLIGEHL